jgi:exosome complex RNA-binding protein Rrp4
MGQARPIRPRQNRVTLRGTHIAQLEATFMKQTNQVLKPRQKLSLGDLILAVSSCTKNTKETVAAVADLLGSGQVRLESNGRFTRAQVC